MKIYREIGSLYIVNRKDDEGYERPVYEIEVDEAVEVVRCKDCKMFEAGETDYWCVGWGAIVTKDGYCSWGEKK